MKIFSDWIEREIHPSSNGDGRIVVHLGVFQEAIVWAVRQYDGHVVLDRSPVHSPDVERQDVYIFFFPVLSTLSIHQSVRRFLSQPFYVAEVFTGNPGKYVTLEETIQGFEEILDGKHDDKPEQAFYMKGRIDEVKSL